jgi:hypothetical protein
MRKLIATVLTVSLLFSAGCSKKWKMSDVKMPEMLQEEKPERMIQKHIAAVLKADTDANWFGQIKELLDVARDVGFDQRRLTAEVLGYAGRIDSNEELARYDRMLEALHIAKPALVDVAAAKLESAGGAEEKACRNLLRLAAPPESRAPADFSHFRHYLEVRAAQPPEKLILWMFDRDAGSALREMMAVYPDGTTPEEKRTLLIAARVVDQADWKLANGLARPDEADPLAADELARVAAQKHWWARLYVAQVMARNPAVRKPETARALAADENAMVRKVASQIAK